MAMPTLKTPAKILLAVVGVVLLFFIASWTGIIGFKPMESLIPKSAELLPDAPANLSAQVMSLPLPTKTPTMKGAKVKALCWAWNSQMGMLYSNGGPTTTQGSLMEKYGVKLTLERQDMVPRMQEEQIKFAKALADGNANPQEGVPVVFIMGDGAPAYLKGINDQLKDLGTEYYAEIVGIIGKSNGEDQMMGPPELQGNPQALKGMVATGYIGDGDWNICLKYCGDNGIKNNPDLKTYDPDALNWIAADDYIDACKKYITGYKEKRKVVRNGKLTGDEIEITPNIVTTWTPGDVMVAKEKGGLVRIVSTAEYRSQMPNTMIAIKKWADANRNTVESMLAAIYEGGDQVKVYQEALQKAAEVATLVYKEQSPAYWIKYYKGVEEKDRQGFKVKLGGSSVCNAADGLQWFGLNGGANIYQATYNVFAEILVQQYPKMFPNYLPYDQVVDASFVQGAANKVGKITVAETAEYSAGGPTDIIAEKSFSIEFATGSATILPRSVPTLNQIYNSLIVSDGLYVTLQGHTDNVGSRDANMSLSEARANSVKQWLQAKAPKQFPNSRFTVESYGPDMPLADNSSEVGRQKNRRVTIIQGK